VFISAGLCIVAGGLAALTIRNPRGVGLTAEPHNLHCGLDAPPSLATAEAVAVTAATERPEPP
jgi:hypothetical protein